MSDLVEFLLARAAEDEWRARQAAGDLAERLERQAERVARIHGDASPPDGAISPADALWWTAKDAASWVRAVSPARVLAECEAKRRAVAMLRSMQDQAWQDSPDTRHLLEVTVSRGLRLLALPYADHPDYREEWRA